MSSVSQFTYELSILAKAIQHKNLSTAANHVGLSQPQLSRLIQKLENEFRVVLLDRSSRRKSGWTPLATDLAEAYMRSMGRFEAEILSITNEREVDELRIGTLEGLAGIAMSFTQQIFEKLKMRKVDLDVFDYRELDSLFLSGQLDLIFTARLPSQQKFKYSLEVGYQQHEKVSQGDTYLVLSPFEWPNTDEKEARNYNHVLVSNSLAVRSRWLRELGGAGTLPIDAKRGKGKGYYSVYLLGNDLLSPRLWERISEFGI